MLFATFFTIKTRPASAFTPLAELMLCPADILTAGSEFKVTFNYAKIYLQI